MPESVDSGIRIHIFILRLQTRNPWSPSQFMDDPKKGGAGAAARRLISSLNAKRPEL